LIILVMPAKAGIQQVRGGAPKESFAPADAGALDFPLEFILRPREARTGGRE
jgi:hypothetical protein